MTGVPLKEVQDRQAAVTGPAAATSSTLSSPAAWFVNWATGGQGGDNGPVVNEFTALNYAALYTCVSLIAGTIGSLPLKVYSRRQGGGQDEAPERPEYDLLQYEFNANTSAMTGREAGVGHLLTWGNSYAQLVRGKGGKLLGINPIGPDVVKAYTSRGALAYEVKQRETGEVLGTYSREDVLHVPGMTFDALCGISPVRTARTTIRTGMTLDTEAEQYIRNGIRPPGALALPAGKKFSNDQQAHEWRDRFKRIHATHDSARQVLILEDGADWKQLGIDPESAQLLESRKFSRGEIAGLYHVPPHLSGDVEKTTSWGTGIEELTIGFVVYCILPHLRRIEQEYNRKLFRGDRRYFCEHVLAGLLRGDQLKRAQALEIMHRRGIVTDNEWRRMEGMNPVIGGDVRHFLLTEGRIDDTGEDIPPPAAPSPAPGTKPATSPPADANAKLAASLRKAFVGAVARCLRKEAAEAKKAAAKPGFAAWAEEFYSRHSAMVVEHTGPVAEAWVAAFPDAPKTLAVYPARHVARSKAELIEAAEIAMTQQDLSAMVGGATDVWLTDRLAELESELQSVGMTDEV